MQPKMYQNRQFADQTVRNKTACVAAIINAIPPYCTGRSVGIKRYFNVKTACSDNGLFDTRGYTQIAAFTHNEVRFPSQFK